MVFRVKCTNFLVAGGDISIGLTGGMGGGDPEVSGGGASGRGFQHGLVDAGQGDQGRAGLGHRREHSTDSFCLDSAHVDNPGRSRGAGIGRLLQAQDGGGSGRAAREGGTDNG